jgi:molybdopterin-guanine dinucleotide biosynthesis protein B
MPSGGTSVYELASRGYRVATVKHTHHEIEFDRGKDSRRHLEAGSVSTIIAGSREMVKICPIAGEPLLEQILRLAGEDYDILICEGFKDEIMPRISLYNTGMTQLRIRGSDDGVDATSDRS